MFKTFRFRQILPPSSPEMISYVLEQEASFYNISTLKKCYDIATDNVLTAMKLNGNDAEISKTT